MTPINEWLPVLLQVTLVLFQQLVRFVATKVQRRLALPSNPGRVYVVVVVSRSIQRRGH